MDQAAGGSRGTIGVAFVGVGGRGHGLLQSTLKIAGVRVVAVCDAVEENLDRAAGTVVHAIGEHPFETADWTEALARPDVDAVVSALPCDLHAACYLEAIAAGKDLYGEKPMCTTVADCDAVVRAAEASD